MKNMDISLNFQEIGNKEDNVLILLHGNGEDCTYFENQLKYFSKKYRVFAIDTRGHGKSKRGEMPFNIKQFADDLNNFMEEHEITNAIILGFSDGANIAMRFILKYPNKIRALILNGGNLNSKGVKFSVQFPIEVGYRICKIFANKSADALKNMELLGLMVNDPNIEINELKNIDVPTLVICGNKDMIKYSHTKMIADNIKNAELVVIDGDHFIANNCHDAFNKEVEKFLNKHKIC